MASKPLRAYLSGGMEHARNAGADWRRAMERFLTVELGHTVFNPNTESDLFLGALRFRKKFAALKRTDVDRYTDIVSEIVDYDSHAVAVGCEYVVCYWDRAAERGAGTKGEITLARYFGKPVFLVSRRPAERIPGWVLGCATARFPDFATLQQFLRTIFHPTGGSHGRSIVPKGLLAHRRSRKRSAHHQSAPRRRTSRR